MPNQPLVSIIVPTYNRAYCLPRTLDSALAQTHTNLEILVIDDGSTDDTRALLSEKYADEPRVRYLYQENQRVAAARNHGLSKAHGDYIAFLDSDDLWDTWKLELQVACMEQNPDIGMVWTEMRAVDPQGKIVSEGFLRTMYSAYQWFSNEQLFPQSRSLSAIAPTLASVTGSAKLYWGDIYSQMIMGNMVHTSTVLLRKERLADVQAFNTKYQPTGEDYDFHLRTCRAGQVGYLDLPTIDYQIGMPDRLTRHETHLAIATYFLEVIEREMAEHGDRITLTPAMRNAVRAEAHEWIGYQLLERGDTGKARGHFRQSLRYNPWQPKTVTLYAASLLSGGILRSVRGAYRAVKPKPKQVSLH